MISDSYSYGILFKWIRRKPTKRYLFLDFRLARDFYLDLMWIVAVFCLKVVVFPDWMRLYITIIHEYNYQLQLILLLLSSIGCYFSLLVGICVTLTLWTLTRITVEWRESKRVFRIRLYMTDFRWVFLRA